MRNNFPIFPMQAKHFREERIKVRYSPDGKKFHYTQEEICRIIGRDLKTYRNWEKGFERPNGVVLVQLAELYDVSTDYLLGRISEKNHDLKYIHEETGLSEAAITVLRYINSFPRNLYDEAFTINRKIPYVLNMILNREAKAIENTDNREAYCLNDLFTMIYDYLAADNMKTIGKDSFFSSETIAVVDDLSFFPVEVSVPALMKEAKMSEIRKELDSFRPTKKAAK